MPPYHILVINPGSTSTKVAVYEDERPLCVSTIRHTPDELAAYAQIIDQHDFRRQLVTDWLAQNNIPLRFDAIIGRGGLIKPIPGGVYRVNRKMCFETYYALRKHACNLGCILAYELAKEQGGGCQAYIADPVTVDELVPEARVSGSPLMPRLAIWHALNQRAIARRYARQVGCSYNDLNLIVCHLGEAYPWRAHEHGRAIDANNALDGEGRSRPKEPAHCPLPTSYTCATAGATPRSNSKACGRTGRTDGAPRHNRHIAIMQMIEQGNERARLLINAMIFHTAKQIAAEGAVLCGRVDAILLTGGMAHSAYITEGIKQRVSYLAPVHVFPGEDEMEALALNALAVLRGECQAKEYE